MKNPKILILGMTLIGGVILLSPFVDYQWMLATGDHGRDLYCAEASLKGALPYRDYWWVYGPLMPYYYALFFKIFGITMKTALLGKLFLFLMAGAFYFLSLGVFVSLPLASIATFWFWFFSPDFFFTYNHAAGTVTLMAITYLTFLYLRFGRLKYLWGGLFAIFTLCLIKINFGLAALLVFLLTVLINDKAQKSPSGVSKRYFYVTALLLLPGAVFAIYFFLLKDLPLYAIRQCLPYYNSDNPYHTPIIRNIIMWGKAIAFNMNASWPNRFFALLVIVSAAQTLMEIFKNKVELALKKQILLAVGFLVLFYIANFHEYLESGVLYRTEWARPFSLVLLFLFIGFAVRNSRRIQILLFVAFAIIIGVVYFPRVRDIEEGKLQHFFSLKRAQVSVGNPPDWVSTVTETVRYLQGILKPDETFFALPYDPLYYFLTEKPSPTRQLIFFVHINIPEEQEKTVIQELEKKNVNYVLLSSRSRSQEKEMGILGETYCPLIGRYLKENFETIAVFGDWKNPPGWAWNHGTMILKRIRR